MFVPDYDTAPASLDTSGSFCATTSLGCWTAQSLVVSGGFATAGGKSGTAQLDSTVGGHPIGFSSVALKADTYLFGYPAAGKYGGKDLTYCRGPLGTDPLNANLTYRVACDMTGGSSGGPWFTPFSSGSGTLMSVNSYGYSGVTAMHGPMLNTETQAMFATAGTTGTNTIYN